MNIRLQKLTAMTDYKELPPRVQEFVREIIVSGLTPTKAGKITGLNPSRTLNNPDVVAVLANFHVTRKSAEQRKADNPEHTYKIRDARRASGKTFWQEVLELEGEPTTPAWALEETEYDLRSDQEWADFEEKQRAAEAAKDLLAEKNATYAAAVQHRAQLIHFNKPCENVLCPHCKPEETTA